MLKNLVLVFNFGSSSLKFSILDPKNEVKYLYGSAECLYLPKSSINWKILKNKKNIIFSNNLSHKKALDFIVNDIFFQEKKIFNRIFGIGHRVVHGGMNLIKSVIINDEVIKKIKKNIIFSPLHNPVNLLGITSSLKYFSGLKDRNVAVLDTSFYHNLPESSYLYAIPYYFYSDYGIRRYGAHGISHFYVANEASRILKKKFSKLNVITCHLGSGSSVTVICNGKCVDTSMGLTPLEGLVMGTRSGDLDPAIIFFMKNILGIHLNDIEKILMYKSGILGLTGGLTSDFRSIEKKYFFNKESKRAVDVFCHRLKKYISSYFSLLNNRLDAVVFTGGIGENSFLVRKIVLYQLQILGLKLDDKKNKYMRFGKSGFINTSDSIPILVIPTNEDIVIARETMNLLK